ncbi:SH3 domain-containing protein [Massilia sp. CF038]|uniref:SH3 domain-containing protein n=1 Tax=Massilia sp. CF038 TaxID=1881045 RepID=UPI000918EB9C|nr:SH3 domain-containing protein [Massilia sp. CF038]SHH40263.1 SH3 domain-containing protein [Massilia sp. CF038]
MTFPRIFASALLLLASAGAQAFDFKSIGAAPAILYDAPSVRGGKLFIAPRGMPVEVVLTYGEWVKVRDASGDMAWTEARTLSPKRNVVVRTANAKVRPTADENGIPLMTADKGVLLELADPQVSTWVKVRHKDGIIGYIKAVDIWGI